MTDQVHDMCQAILLWSLASFQANKQSIKVGLERCLVVVGNHSRLQLYCNLRVQAAPGASLIQMSSHLHMAPQMYEQSKGMHFNLRMNSHSNLNSNPSPVALIERHNLDEPQKSFPLARTHLTSLLLVMLPSQPQVQPSALASQSQVQPSALAMNLQGSITQALGMRSLNEEAAMKSLDEMNTVTSCRVKTWPEVNIYWVHELPHDRRLY